MIDVDARISAALGAAADTIQDRDLRPELVAPQRNRRRWLAPALAAAAVVCLGVSAALIVAPHHAATIQAGGSLTSGTPSPGLSDGNPSATCTSVCENIGDEAPAALRFVQNELGFSDLGVGSPTLVQVNAAAYAEIGPAQTDTVGLTLRIGSIATDGSGLWQLSGTTTDVTTGPTMTLDQPSYGSQVAGTVTVAGSAPGKTGTVHLALLAAGTPVATGQTEVGSDGSWQTEITVPDSAHGPLTIVASLGGTDTAPAEFAVTGVYAP